VFDHRPDSGQGGDGGAAAEQALTDGQARRLSARRGSDPGTFGRSARRASAVSEAVGAWPAPGTARLASARAPGSSRRDGQRGSAGAERGAAGADGDSPSHAGEGGRAARRQRKHEGQAERRAAKEARRLQRAEAKVAASQARGRRGRRGSHGGGGGDTTESGSSSSGSGDANLRRRRSSALENPFAHAARRSSLTYETLLTLAQGQDGVAASGAGGAAAAGAPGGRPLGRTLSAGAMHAGRGGAGGRRASPSPSQGSDDAGGRGARGGKGRRRSDGEAAGRGRGGATDDPAGGRGGRGPTAMDARSRRSRARLARLIDKLGASRAREAPFPLRWTLMQINSVYGEREALTRSLLASAGGIEPATLVHLAAIAAHTAGASHAAKHTAARRVSAGAGGGPGHRASSGYGHTSASVTVPAAGAGGVTASAEPAAPGSPTSRARSASGGQARAAAAGAPATAPRPYLFGGAPGASGDAAPFADVSTGAGAAAPNVPWQRMPSRQVLAPLAGAAGLLPLARPASRGQLLSLPAAASTGTTGQPPPVGGVLLVRGASFADMLARPASDGGVAGFTAAADRSSSPTDALALQQSGSGALGGASTRPRTATNTLSLAQGAVTAHRGSGGGGDAPAPASPALLSAPAAGGGGGVRLPPLALQQQHHSQVLQRGQSREGGGGRDSARRPSLRGAPPGVGALLPSSLLPITHVLALPAESAAALLCPPREIAGELLARGRFDWFVADCLTRRFGLELLANRHVLTLLRCVRAYAADARVAVFSRLLTGRLGGDDALFYLAARALCRTGVPREAWRLVGQPVGGRGRGRVNELWAAAYAGVVLRRMVQRKLQARRRRGGGALVDLVRARRAVRAAVACGVLAEAPDSVAAAAGGGSGGHHLLHMAGYGGAGGGMAPGRSVVNADALVATTPLLLTPRTRASVRAALLAGRSAGAHGSAAFPFVRAAARLAAADASTGGVTVPPVPLIALPQPPAAAAPSTAGTSSRGGGGGGRPGPGGPLPPLALPNGAHSHGHAFLPAISGSSAWRSGVTVPAASLTMAPVPHQLQVPPAAGVTTSIGAGIHTARGSSTAGGGSDSEGHYVGGAAGGEWGRERRRRPSVSSTDSHHGGGGGGGGGGGQAPPWQPQPQQQQRRRPSVTSPEFLPAAASTPALGATVADAGPWRLASPTANSTAGGGRPGTAGGGGSGPPPGWNPGRRPSLSRRIPLSTVIQAMSSAPSGGHAADGPPSGFRLESPTGSVGSSRGGGGATSARRRESSREPGAGAGTAPSSRGSSRRERGRSGSLGSQRGEDEAAAAAATAAAAAAAGDTGAAAAAAIASHRAARAEVGMARLPGVLAAGGRLLPGTGKSSRRLLSPKNSAAGTAAAATAAPVPRSAAWRTPDGPVFSLWTPSRLARLLLMTPGEPDSAGAYLRSTATNVSFPDSGDGVPGQAHGHTSWVSLRRARELIRLLLLPDQADDAARAVDAMAVTGEPPTWAAAAAKWPRHLRRVLGSTARVDRDAFVALLVLLRHGARKELVAGLKEDFAAAAAAPDALALALGPASAAYLQRAAAPPGPRRLTRPQFAAAASCVFPGLLSQPQLDALFDQGVALAAAAAAAAAAAQGEATGDGDADGDGGDDGRAGNLRPASAGLRRPSGRRGSEDGGVGDVGGWTSATFVAAMVALGQHLLAGDQVQG
jgi:hypothetical protein